MQPQNMFLENRKVMRFTVKCREIGGERINKGIPLIALISLHPYLIIFKCFKTSSPQPAPQAGIDHFFFAVVELDTAVLIKNDPNSIEIFRCI